MNSFKLIQDILKKPEFKEHLEHISSYSAYMKQERPIQYALAELLDSDGFDVWLEFKRTDLKCIDTLIELKFYYEFDLIHLKNEISKVEHIKNFKAKIEKINYTNREIAPPIYKDLEKHPDIFLLIILSRDLRLIQQESFLSSKIKYFKNVINAYKSGFSYCSKDLLSIATNFIEDAKKYLRYPSSDEQNFFYQGIKINTIFPSCYHFYGYLLI